MFNHQDQLELFINIYDFKRLSSYAKNISDHYLIIDIL